MVLEYWGEGRQRLIIVEGEGINTVLVRFLMYVAGIADGGPCWSGF